MSCTHAMQLYKNHRLDKDQQRIKSEGFIEEFWWSSNRAKFP